MECGCVLDLTDRYVWERMYAITMMTLMMKAMMTLMIKAMMTLMMKARMN